MLWRFRTDSSERTQNRDLFFAASVFFRLGVFSSFTMRLSIFWKTKCAKHGRFRDNEVAEDDRTNFLEWAKQLKNLNDLKLNQNYFTNKLICIA